MSPKEWRPFFLSQVAHRDDLDPIQIKGLLDQAVPSLDREYVLAELRRARDLHLAAKSLEAQDLIRRLVEENHDTTREATT